MWRGGGPKSSVSPLKPGENKLFFFFWWDVPGLLSGLSKRSFWKTVFLSPTENKWLWRKSARLLLLHTTSWNKGFCSSDPGNRRTWRKWRVLPRQNDRLPKAPFWQPWLLSGSFGGVRNFQWGLSGPEQNSVIPLISQYIENLVDVSDILGKGEGGVWSAGRWGGGFAFLSKIPARGGVSEGPRGWEGVCGELGCWGGGLIFFFWAEMSTKRRDGARWQDCTFSEHPYGKLFSCLRSGVVQANQTQKRRFFASRFGKKRCFFEFRVFLFLEKDKTIIGVNRTFWSLFWVVLVLLGQTLRIQRNTSFRELARESAFCWLGLPERLLIVDVKFASNLHVGYFWKLLHASGLGVVFVRASSSQSCKHDMQKRLAISESKHFKYLHMIYIWNFNMLGNWSCKLSIQMVQWWGVGKLSEQSERDYECACRVPRTALQRPPNIEKVAETAGVTQFLRVTHFAERSSIKCAPRKRRRKVPEICAVSCCDSKQNSFKDPAKFPPLWWIANRYSRHPSWLALSKVSPGPLAILLHEDWLYYVVRWISPQWQW